MSTAAQTAATNDAPPPAADAFADAFALMSLDEPPATGTGATPPATTEGGEAPKGDVNADGKAVTEQTETEKAAEAAKTAEGEGEGEGAAPPAATIGSDKAKTPPPPAADRDDILNRFAEILADAKPKGQQEQKPPAQQEPPALYTAEEQALIQQYRNDYPDVAQAEFLQRRGEYQQLTAHIFGEVIKTLRPIAEQLEVLATRTHIADLQTAMPDYSPELVDKVSAWVNEQPKYLQEAYTRVIENGTAEEVVDLIQRYTAATGQPAPKTGGEPTPTPKKETELPETTKKAVAALAPVSSQRSTPKTAADPQDFNSAFDAFADKVQ